MKRLLLLITTLVSASLSYSQLLTWTPPFPTENNASQTLVITLDATKGNQGLMNYSATSDVYAHVGVITNKSSSSSDWKYVKFTWATTPSAANTTYIGNNKWTYTITGSLRTFFGITDATETIQKIALLFRSGNGNTVQRNADGSDMYIPIYAASDFAVRLSQPPREPKYNPTPESQAWSAGTTFTIAANASKPSTMKLYHNGTVIASSSNVTTLSGSSTVMANGNQQIVAEASDGTTTKYDTINIFVGSSPVVALPAGVQDGINYGANNTSVTLVLRAPGKTVATVIGDFNNWTQNTASIMNKTPDGKYFWITINGLTAGTEYAYQYVVDGNIKIADPYTEKILDPANDPSIPSTTYHNLKAYPSGQTGIVSVLQTAQLTYAWAVNTFNRPDKRGLVIYELLVRDFIAAHDWKTLKDTLSYLKRLGINAIEVMPFNEFQNNSSWGYDPDFYFAPDKYYGPKNTLKQFIDSCHKNGIAVIMDIVLNHTYGSSPLALLYWDAANNRPAANNPWYNAVAPHAFGFGDDFNHESTDTKDFFNRVLQHWLNEYKIDGYRFDFSKGLTQKPSTTDAAFSAYDASRIAILKGYANTIRAVDASAYIILEHFCDNTEEKELSDNDMLLWGNLAYNYEQAAMGYNTDWDFSNGIYSVRGWTKPYLVTYAESHDEERIVYKNLTYGNFANSAHNVRDTTIALKRMELASAFLFTIPGPKMLWQFGELGYPYSINTCTDLSVNNNCRLSEKPIRWNYLSDARRVSVYNTYSKLINLRFHPWYTGVFQSATVAKDLSSAFKWIKLTTTNDTSDLVVIGNFDVVAQTGSVTFPTAGTWYDYFGNFIHTSTGAAQSFTLQPGEFHVYVNRNVNNVTATPVSNVPWNGETLEANIYPNPIQTNATFEVQLPQSAITTINLYNSLGQFVRTVYNGFLQKGTKQIPLQRKGIPTGTYYLKLQQKEQIKTIPFTLQ